MPFVSQAQRAYFYANPKLHKYIPEFEAATPKGVKLPQHKETAVSNFDKLASKLAGRPGVNNPRALAAVIGRKKYGAHAMAEGAAHGKPAANYTRRAK